MKRILTIAILTLSQLGFSQAAFHNMGNIQMHEGAQIGFHTDVINDGNFDSNKGLTGLYNDNDLVISGDNKPVFHDLEVAVKNNVYLLVSVAVTNSHNFIEGKVVTPRDDKNISFEFLNDALYAGVNDSTYIDGYASTSTGLGYELPVGDKNRYSPITLKNNITQIVTAAYYNEDPNFPSAFAESFNTDLSEGLHVSKEEFWDLNGNEPVNITLGWDASSELSNLTDNPDQLRIVGWNKDSNQWVDLGNFKVTGTLQEGTITSLSFMPDNYEIIAIGSALNPDEVEPGTPAPIVVRTNLFDVAGNLIRTFGYEEEVDFSGMAIGVYIADVRLNNGKRYTEKLLNAR